MERKGRDTKVDRRTAVARLNGRNNWPSSHAWPILIGSCVVPTTRNNGCECLFCFEVLKIYQNPTNSYSTVAHQPFRFYSRVPTSHRRWLQVSFFLSNIAYAFTKASAEVRCNKRNFSARRLFRRVCLVASFISFISSWDPLQLHRQAQYNLSCLLNVVLKYNSLILLLLLHLLWLCGRAWKHSVAVKANVRVGASAVVWI